MNVFPTAALAAALVPLQPSISQLAWLTRAGVRRDGAPELPLLLGDLRRTLRGPLADLHRDPAELDRAVADLRVVWRCLREEVLVARLHEARRRFPAPFEDGARGAKALAAIVVDLWDELGTIDKHLLEPLLLSGRPFSERGLLAEQRELVEAGLRVLPETVDARLLVEVLGDVLHVVRAELLRARRPA